MTPNPATGHGMTMLTINTGKEGVATLSLHDMDGRLVYSDQYTIAIGQNDVSIDISHLSSGIYTLRVAVGRDVKTIKLVK